MFKFKINDTIKITAGKDKGQTGKIIKIILPGNKVVVENKNLYTRHLKARPDQPGKKVKLPRPIPVGNIALICPNCQKPTRVGFDVSQKPKIRICRKCQQVIKDQTAKK